MLKIIKRIVFTLILFVLFVAASAYIFSRFYLDKYLSRELIKIVDESSSGFYQLKIKKIQTNILLGSIELNEVEIKPNFAKFKGFVLENGNSYALDIRTFSIKGFRIWDIYKNNEIILSEFKLTEPKILITRKFAKEDTTTNRINIKSLLLKNFQKVEIGSIKFDKASIIYLDSLTNKPAEHALKDVFFELKEFYLDKKSTLTQDNFYYSKNISFHAGSYFYSLPGEAYDLKVDKVQFSARDSTLSVKKVVFFPKFNKLEFAKRNKYCIDRVELTIENIRSTGVDVREILYNGKVNCDSIILSSVFLNDFKDKRKIPDPNAAKKLPTSFLKSIPILIHIKEFNIKNANILYEEIAENGSIPGKLFLNDLEIGISNIVNDSSKIAVYPIMKLIAKGKLMNKAKFTASINFDMNSTIDQFEMSGNVSQVKFSVFNKLMYNLVGIQTSDGTLDNLSFIFSANDNISNGRLKFLYHDLKINLEDKKEDKKKKLKNLAVNTFVLNANPLRKNDTRTGTISARRNKSKLIFNYIFESLSSGIMETVLNNVAIGDIQNLKLTTKKIFTRDPEKKKERKERKQFN